MTTSDVEEPPLSHGRSSGEPVVGRLDDDVPLAMRGCPSGQRKPTMIMMTVAKRAPPGALRADVLSRVSCLRRIVPVDQAGFRASGSCRLGGRAGSVRRSVQPQLSAGFSEPISTVLAVPPVVTPVPTVVTPVPPPVLTTVYAVSDHDGPAYCGHRPAPASSCEWHVRLLRCRRPRRPRWRPTGHVWGCGRWRRAGRPRAALRSRTERPRRSPRPGPRQSSGRDGLRDVEDVLLAEQHGELGLVCPELADLAVLEVLQLECLEAAVILLLDEQQVQNLDQVPVDVVPRIGAISPVNLLPGNSTTTQSTGPTSSIVCVICALPILRPVEEA